MAKVTHTNYAKMTVWTPTTRIDLEGPRMACAIELFGTLDTQQMEKALIKMQERLKEHREWGEQQP